MIHSLHHLSIAAQDADAAGRAYELLLGRAPDGTIEVDGVRQVWFSTANVRLALIAPTGAGALGDAARARLAEHGEGLWRMAFAVADLGKAANLAERRALAPTRVFNLAVESHGAAAGLPAFSLAPAATHGLDIAFVETPGPAIGAAPSPGGIAGLDHVVVRTPNPGRAVELFGGRLGLDLRLDRTNPAWGARLIFFRCGDLVVEIAHMLKAGVTESPDTFGGFSWQAPDIEATRERLSQGGLDVSEARTGRRPGTFVCTVRNGNVGVPTILLGGAGARKQDWEDKK
jgi:catechol 2,3-dioxygenase-like lactoylglutathione lyase family enzyme